MDFDYVTTNVRGPGCSSNDFETFFPGCKCRGPCIDSATCPCLRFGCAYEENGRLSEERIVAKEVQRPIFECSFTCKCKRTCRNRLVQLGVQIPLHIFETGQSKGYGLHCSTALKRGQFVCEYAGEIISEQEAAERLQKIPDGAPNYIFVLREKTADQNEPIVTCIDPTKRGNLGRFVNHSCDPNLVIEPVRYDNLIPHLALFAKRDIHAKEELCYDYGGSENFGMVTSKNLSTKRCHCGSKNCRGFLPFDDAILEKFSKK